MKKFNKKSVIIIGVTLIAVIIGIFLQQDKTPSQPSEESAIRSPYVGQEKRGIKALSQKDVEGLLAGAGTPFGGMAKPAELNGYPGPRHVLDAYDAGEFELTNEQHNKIKSLYEKMRLEAVELGNQIINIEKEIDDAFKEKTITNAFLQRKISESAKLYGQLRVVHLKYHLSMMDVLTPQQVEQYNMLRGYNSGDPCKNIPEGHDPEMWKLHNNCG